MTDSQQKDKSRLKVVSMQLETLKGMFPEMCTPEGIKAIGSIKTLVDKIIIYTNQKQEEIK